MSQKTANHKILFGLKVKHSRLNQNLSFADLSKSAGMSVSYLNEIEKGKKYPKEAKARLLAEALGMTYKQLISPELPTILAPVEALLNSNFLNELPLDLFGIELNKVVEIIANSPLEVGAFISTLVELSRSYAVHEENFYLRALRAYQELHNNYFQDIENEADRFVETYNIPTEGAVPHKLLETILKDDFSYKISEDGLKKHPELGNMRSVFIPRRKRLLLNGKLNDMQKAFQLAKELGFSFLELKERPYTSSILNVNTFQEVLNNYKAAYFAVAILINRASFVEDLKAFFNQKTWNPKILLNLAGKYKASSSVLYQRFNVLPKYFGLNKVFYIRSFHNLDDDTFVLDKELHLNHKHRPHSNGLLEHYCRRWLATSLFRKLQRTQKESADNSPIFGIQKSTYHGSKDEYLVVSIALPSYPSPNKNTSVTIGVLLDDNARKVIKFVDDPAIISRVVNVTCERCPIEDCTERAAPPTVIEEYAKLKKVEDSLTALLKS